VLLIVFQSSSANTITIYSSHWSAQYGDGVLGPIIIDGPATAQYDEDLGALPLTDWYYTPAFTLNEQAQHGTLPVPNNILVNGTHVDGNGNGRYAKMTVEKV
jgi:FtsP/CotA-like multicopper oxidase with cupredoxin domain